MAEKQTPVQQVMDQSPDNLSVLFDEEVQNAIIGHLLQDEKFFVQSLGKIKPNYFNNPFSNQLLSIQLDLYSELKRFPTVQEVVNHKKIKFQTPEEQSAIVSHLNRVISDTKKASIEYLKPRLTDWLHQLLLKKFLRESLQKYGSADFKDVFYEMEGLKKLREEFSYEDKGEIKFTGFEEYLKDSELNLDKALTTGLKILDQALLDGATKGGLLPGDISCVMGSTDSGKSTVEMTIACHNIVAGKDVLWMTHEGKPTDLRERMLCSILTTLALQDKTFEFEGSPFVNRIKLIKMNKTAAGRKLIKFGVDLIDKHLLYYPYNRPGMVVEDVEPIIRRQQDKKVILSGKGFDLLVNDYPAKLGSKRGNHGLLPHYVEKGQVYDYFVQMAIEFDWHCLVAVQTNREGYKTNNRNADYNNSRLLTIDDVADAYVISNVVTNFWSINRDPISAAGNRVTYYICKSKNSATGLAIICRSAYGARVTHDENMGAIGYNDTMVFGPEIENILGKKENHGKIFTIEEIGKQIAVTGLAV